MAAKNSVKYNAEEMQTLLDGVSNASAALEALCSECEAPIRQLLSDDLISGEDTEDYKEAFRRISTSTISAKSILNSFNTACKTIADSMGLAINVVKKSAAQTAEDMQKVADGIKSSTSAK